MSKVKPNQMGLPLALLAATLLSSSFAWTEEVVKFMQLDGCHLTSEVPVPGKKGEVAALQVIADARYDGTIEAENAGNSASAEKNAGGYWHFQMAYDYVADGLENPFADIYEEFQADEYFHVNQQMPTPKGDINLIPKPYRHNDFNTNSKILLVEESQNIGGGDKEITYSLQGADLIKDQFGTPLPRVKTKFSLDQKSLTKVKGATEREDGVALSSGDLLSRAQNVPVKIVAFVGIDKEKTFDVTCQRVEVVTQKVDLIWSCEKVEGQTNDSGYPNFEIFANRAGLEGAKGSDTEIQTKVISGASQAESGYYGNRGSNGTISRYEGGQDSLSNLDLFSWPFSVEEGAAAVNFWKNDPTDSLKYNCVSK